MKIVRDHVQAESIGGQLPGLARVLQEVDRLIQLLRAGRVHVRITIVFIRLQICNM